MREKAEVVAHANRFANTHRGKLRVPSCSVILAILLIAAFQRTCLIAEAAPAPQLTVLRSISSQLFERTTGLPVSEPKALAKDAHVYPLITLAHYVPSRMWSVAIVVGGTKATWLRYFNYIVAVMC